MLFWYRFHLFNLRPFPGDWPEARQFGVHRYTPELVFSDNCNNIFRPATLYELKPLLSRWVDLKQPSPKLFGLQYVTDDLMDDIRRIIVDYSIHPADDDQIAIVYQMLKAA